jgi:hypothetical protein
MSGLLRRLTRRRPATADETGSPTPGPSEPAGAPTDAPAETSGGHPLPTSREQPTQILSATGEHPVGSEAGSAVDEPASGEIVPVEQQSGAELVPAAGPESGAAPAVPGSAHLEPADATAPAQPEPAGPPATRPAARDLPAGVDPAELESGPIGSARRGRLRRRLRYLRRARELLLRDLGGFVYELHRTAGGTLQESHRRLVTAKADRLGALDAEVRGLESRLGQPHAEPLLREPGIGGTCPVCGELHASDARYCSHCGEPLDEEARARREAQLAVTVEPETPEHPAPEPGPASALWAAGPRPGGSAEAADAARLSPSTSEWLTGHQPADRPDEPERAGEPSTAGPDEPGTASAAAASDEPATGDESAAADPDEPATGDQSATADPDEPATDDESAAAPDEPAADAGPGAPGEPRGRSGDSSEFEPNGRRGDDVSPPARDPLGEPRP